MTYNTRNSYHCVSSAVADHSNRWERDMTNIPVAKNWNFLMRSISAKRMYGCMLWWSVLVYGAEGWLIHMYLQQTSRPCWLWNHYQEAWLKFFLAVMDLRRKYSQTFEHILGQRSVVNVHPMVNTSRLNSYAICLFFDREILFTSPFTECRYLT